MGRIFRWGIVIALLVVVGCGVMAMRMVFAPNEDVAVPSLVGLSTVDAVTSLEALGLTAQIDQVDSDQPEGTVISQNFDPGQKTSKGRKIIVKVSRGGAQLQMPDVRGLEFAAAVKALDSAGFKVGTVLRVQDQIKAAGTIIAQNPAAPAMVPGNRMVDLLISEGKSGKEEMVQVPDLYGQTEELAKQILGQSNLTVGRSILIKSDAVPAGAVTRTQPRAGSRVPAGGAVVLYLAQAVPPGDAAAPGTPAAQPQAGASPPSAASTRISTTPAPQAAQPQQTEPAVQTPPAVTAADPAPVRTQPVIAPQETVARKTAKVRYQVPPLSRPLALRIEISDQSGSRVLRDEQANGGEYMTMDVPYAGTASVAIHLGGELVWQERYQ